MSPARTPDAGDLVIEEAVSGRTPATVPPELARAAGLLDGRTVWHVNTTARGGGVAELLRTTVAHHKAAGISSRWLVTRGTPEFFTLTKQLHHLLHGMPGNGQAPTSQDAQMYSAVTAAHAKAVLDRVDSGDIAVLHDPQTLGLAPILRSIGSHVIWRSHIGTRRASALAAGAWDFLAPYLGAVDQFVFSAAGYVPAALRSRRVIILPPAIDASSAKCRPLSAGEVSSTLRAIGLQDTPRGVGPPALLDLAGAARVLQEQPLPADAPVVLQISRWDPLKDMAGVQEAFAREIADGTSAHLVLAGPDPDEVSDDLENQLVLTDVINGWQRLPAAVRRRIHLVVLRLGARQANALIVNSLQRRATVVAQKSLEEGFGLAVTEAMHKRKPIVASQVGGILEQITDRVHGLLVAPRDHRAFGAAVRTLLDDPALAARLAAAAGAHCDRAFLIENEHRGYAELFCWAGGQKASARAR